jgi:hypothetical protein
MNGAERPTPWDVVFGAAPFSDEVFPEIAEEAEARGVETAAPDQFLMLASVGRLLRSLTPEDADPATAAGRVGAPVDSVRRYGALVFHAFHSWLGGRTVVSFDEPRARRLVERRHAIGTWPIGAPARAGYLQLPRNLLWARVADEAPAEPVDGIFWTFVTPPPATPREAALALLLVLGLREGRPGISVIEATAPLPGPPGHWGDTIAREGGQDFANILPGGELSNLYGLVNAAELFKLVSRAFHALAMGDDERNGG